MLLFYYLELNFLVKEEAKGPIKLVLLNQALFPGSTHRAQKEPIPHCPCRGLFDIVWQGCKIFSAVLMSWYPLLIWLCYMVNTEALEKKIKKKSCHNLALFFSLLSFWKFSTTNKKRFLTYWRENKTLINSSVT